MSEPLRYRLLIADIDGTLVPEDKVVRPGVVTAIKAAQARGVRVCLATGRQPRSAHRFVDAVLEGQAPGITAEDGLRATEMVEACYQSVRAGVEVRLPLA